MKQRDQQFKVLRSTAKLFMLLLLSFMISGGLVAQERSISGTISDNGGISLPGVNVIVKGSTSGTVTDINGNFSIKVPNNQAILSFTYVGYKSAEVEVGEQTTLTIVLSEDVKELNEVVVIGYGVQKRSDLTGAVASVKAEDIAKIPVTNVETALQGRAAGVQISQTTGAPGSSVKVRIRGVSSINTNDGSGEPIWIVDGVPAGSNSVNANDIESIEILKDASASAIYGSKGANGVILITTKSGKKGAPVANVNYYHGVQDVPNRIDVASGPEFAAMYTEYQALKSFDPKTNTYKNIAKLQYPNIAGTPTYDYQDMVFRSAIIDNVDFNISAGNDKSTAYLGMGLINQEGILLKTEFEKFNLRLKSDYKIRDWFTVGENFSFTQQNRKGFDEWEYLNEYSSPIMRAITVQPDLAPYDSVGNWKPKTIGNTDNPMAPIDLLNKESNNFDMNGTFFVALEPLKGLKLESKITGSLSFNDNFNFSPTFYFGAGPGQNNPTSSINRGNGKYSGYNWQNLISYNTSILNDFNLALMGGYEVGMSKGENMSGTREDLLTEDEEMWYFDASKDKTSPSQIPSGSGYKSTGYSYIGRLSADYKGIVLFQSNFRRDYSSKFGPLNRSGNFPSFSVGLKFSELGVVKDNVSILSFGKVRYGWGKAGNNAVSDYGYYSTVGTMNAFMYSFNNTPGVTTGIAPDVSPNREIHWEDIVTQNYGLDLAFLENRLSVTVDKFSRENIGMLIRTTLPGIAGWTVRDPYQENGSKDSRPFLNAGKFTNKGWEFTIGWKDDLGKLKYSIDLNYTYVTNEATNLGPDSVKQDGSAKGLGGSITRTTTGGSLGDFYGYKISKIFQLSDTGRLADGTFGIINQPFTIDSIGNKIYAQKKAKPGDFQFQDTNNDGIVNDKDKVVLGNPFAKHLFGVNINLEYSIFDLQMFWQGTYGNKIFNATKFYGFSKDGTYNWNAEYANNHYRASDVPAKDNTGNVVTVFPANTGSKYPRIDINNDNSNFSNISDFYVEDGSYLRLKNIQLGIKLPQQWVNKFSIVEFRIFVGAKNVLTFTKYSGMDPEVSMSDILKAGIDQAAYPQARTFIAGASIKF